MTLDKTGPPFWEEGGGVLAIRPLNWWQRGGDPAYCLAQVDCAGRERHTQVCHSGEHERCHGYVASGAYVCRCACHARQRELRAVAVVVARFAALKARSS